MEGEPMNWATISSPASRRSAAPTELLDDAMVHDDDLVAHLHSLELVVRDIDSGGAHAVVHARSSSAMCSRNSASSAPSGSSMKKAWGGARWRGRAPRR